MAVLSTLQSYGHGFQIKVLSSLLKNKEFIQNVNDVLDTNMFDSPAHKWIVAEALRYYYKYHTTPSPESLQAEVKKIDNEVLKVSVVEQLKESLKAANDDREYVEQEFSNFCRNQQLKNAILESVKLLEKGEYEDIRHIINTAAKAGQDKTIGHEYEKDMETRYRQEQRSPIPTPWDNLNNLLMGGLGVGDLGLIFGNPGGGKCIGPNSIIEIEYEEIGIDVNNKGKTATIWFDSFAEFNIDGMHMWGYEVKNFFEFVETQKLGG